MVKGPCTGSLTRRSSWGWGRWKLPSISPPTVTSKLVNRFMKTNTKKPEGYIKRVIKTVEGVGGGL